MTQTELSAIEVAPLCVNTMRFEGTIKSWNDDRGFGFIVPDQGGDEVFVHIKAFARRSVRPAAGQHVTFEVEVGPQGKKRAKDVLTARVAGAGRATREERPAAEAEEFDLVAGDARWRYRAKQCRRFAL